MKNLPLYLSLLFILTCAKEDSQAPNTSPLSQKNKPFLKQVIYYDDVKRTIIN